MENSSEPRKENNTGSKKKYWYSAILFFLGIFFGIVLAANLMPRHIEIGVFWGSFIGLILACLAA